MSLMKMDNYNDINLAIDTCSFIVNNSLFFDGFDFVYVSFAHFVLDTILLHIHIYY